MISFWAWFASVSVSLWVIALAMDYFTTRRFSPDRESSWSTRYIWRRWGLGYALVLWVGLEAFFVVLASFFVAWPYLAVMPLAFGVIRLHKGFRNWGILRHE